MGHESAVYGVILGLNWKLDDYRSLQRLNQQVIASLPETDDWPFLTRPMFAIAGEQVQSGTYRSQPIFFGGTFKAIEWEWEEWLPKFEALLMRLYWDDVYLHLRTELVGAYEYVYRAELSPDFYKLTQPPPITTWVFSGGPRAFADSGPGNDDDPAVRWRFANGVLTRLPGEE